MKSQKFLDDMKNKSVEQLNLDLQALKKDLFDLRLKNATNQLDSTAKIKTLRRNIARVQTLISQKKLG